MSEQESFIDMATIIREPTPEHISKAASVIEKASKIVILQGAGVSVASGIPDYRSPNGLFAYLREQNLNMTPEEALSLDVFKRDPSIYHQIEQRFFSTVAKLPKGAGDASASGPQPNEGHRLAAHIHRKNKLTRVYTQNVDGLQTAVVPERHVVE